MKTCKYCNSDGTIYFAQQSTTFQTIEMEIDSCNLESGLVIAEDDDNEFELYAYFEIGSISMYTKSAIIKYCPFCGRKLIENDDCDYGNANA